MVEITWWPTRALFYLITTPLRIILAIAFWRRKKSVPPVKNQLLLKSANQLAKEIREKKLKSVEVVLTYIDRIIEVEPYINAVVQNNFDGAIEEARQVDVLIESGAFSEDQLAKELPFLGVPFTVKCLLKVKGFPDTAASIIYKDRIADTDAPIVDLLKNAGGIFLALTNASEFGLSLEARNKLYGKPSNPYDTTRTSGGSSGGETALISSAGSLIGLGNEILGSLRIPAHYCGLFSHKPTRNSLLCKGYSVDLPDYLETIHTTGPICRYSKDLFTVMNVILKTNKDINFQREVDFKNIKIYYQKKLEHVWTFDIDEEIVQAVQNAASYFKTKYGSMVQEIKIPLLNKTNAIVLNSYAGRVPNGIELITEGRIKHLNFIVELFKMLFGKCQFTFGVLVAACWGKWPLFYNENLVSQCDDLDKELQEEFDRLLDINSILLFPTFPRTASYHYEGFTHLPCSCYTGAFNILGLPATQCPIGFDRNGLPIGIQIVGQKGNDVLTLLTAIELEKAFGGWTPPTQELLESFCIETL